MIKLTRFLKGFRKQVILGPMFKMTEAIFELIVPLVVASMIDVGIKNGDTAYVWNMVWIMVLLGVVGLACSLTCQFFASRASQGFGTVVRNELFRHINSLSYAEIDKIGTPSMITRLNNDVNQMQLAVAMLIRLVFRAPFLAIGATVMAMALDLKMSVIFLAAAVLIALALYLVMSHSVPFYGKIQKLLDHVSLITRENLEGVRVIRAFSKQETEERRFEQTSEELRHSSVTVSKLSALLNPVTSIVANLAILAILWFGGMRVNSGTLTQGQVIALWNYMTQILLALIVVANLVVIFTKASASAVRINEIFETSVSVTDAGNAEQVPTPGAPKIELRNVSFSYSGSEEHVLSNVNLSIKAGETIGIIGGTGSGKTTLVNLIPRFYDVDKGEVLVDGVNVKEYPFAQLHGQIGIVPQRAVLFSGSIRSNLRWGCENATDEQIDRALSIAQAKEFVDKLPEGCDTPVLQGGKNFSGGQKQRLTIARALVGEPKILILDDSASALDFATDAALRKALTRDTQNMTVLMVSQRANTVKGADRIIVLDDGEVAGIGTHRDLFESCAVYREICLSQLSSEEAERT
ncbi:ABC transporter ATP-binding protein [Hydrogenoanaerobacterium sp.]|uniref:ABC transporter ATP-binding protein n=1 Tax=Hydrogenoanaerobacterium sp. TaxID=2953763 RepID=UPI00289EA0E6|nr:ABC transporter ATP-binding protein [Hydrogenoanaerobacterium sp.]